MKPQNASQTLPKASNKDLKCSITRFLEKHRTRKMTRPSHTELYKILHDNYDREIVRAVRALSFQICKSLMMTAV